MKYVFKNEYGYYKFCRKIPNSNKQFNFSTGTKRLNRAKKIVNSFLIKSSTYFLHLQNLSKEEIVTRFDEIQQMLEDYKEQALKEYSPFEKSRQEHFAYDGKDGSHQDSAKHWAIELQEHVVGRKTLKQTQELARQILKRSTMPLKTFYQSIKDEEERNDFLQFLIKTEVELLKVDYQRAKEYFDLDYHLEQDKTKQLHEMIAQTVQSQIHYISKEDFEDGTDSSDLDKSKYRRMNKYQAMEDYRNAFITVGKKDENRIFESIQILLQSSDAEFLIDYTEADYELFMFALTYTPTAISIKPKIFEKYEGNFINIAIDFKEGELDFQGYESIEMQAQKTLGGKLIEVKKFLNHCIRRKVLDKNILNVEMDDLEGRFNFSNDYFKGKGKESKERAIYTKAELEKMFDLFIQLEFCKKRDIANFWIPMIALFSGMRLEEICKLKVENIIKEEGIYCFDITPPAKTAWSVRRVPIHSYLLKELNFLDYVEFRKNQNKEMLFNLTPTIVKEKINYSSEWGEAFGKSFRPLFVSSERIEEELVSFHSFRHTFSTRVKSGGADIVDVSRIVGHLVKSTNETPRYYKPPVTDLVKYVEKMKIEDLKLPLKRLAMKYNKGVKYPKMK